MARIPMGTTPVRKPLPNVYTVLLAVAIIALLAAILVVGDFLLSPADTGQGYGLTPGQMFEKIETVDLPTTPKK